MRQYYQYWLGLLYRIDLFFFFPKPYLLYLQYMWEFKKKYFYFIGIEWQHQISFGELL